MDQEIRNKLRSVVTQCRKLLEDSISQELEGKYGIFAKKDQVTADPNAKMTHLTEEEQAARKDILDHFGHIKARGFKPKEALDQLVREIAFTHLNRLCAYKMMEAREVYVGGQKFREAVSRGFKSNGFLFYLGMDGHEADERLYSTGQQELAYRHFLDWLGGLLSDEIGVLFNPNDPANRLYPRQKTIDEVLDLLNSGGIKADEIELRAEWPKIWAQDETIGWVYQYFTPKELRDAARDPKKGGSQAPRNSYELAFRNQFFTPRYVVEFLTDNTLGRIWYEMRQGDTKVKDQCLYIVRHPTEIFLQNGEEPPKGDQAGRDDLTQEELLKLPVYIPHRPKKDPRELKILDPACGSGHFLLYCFDLLLTIYEEAYADPELGPPLQKDYPTLEDLRRDVPRLILAHNLHGIDIDLRCTQIAALALWLRCQRAYQEMGLKNDRPKIKRSNFVCAEPMPGEEQMLREFVSQLEPKLLSQLVEVVFDKMKLAGEAGSLLKIEEEIRGAVAEARKQWLAGPTSIQRTLFDYPEPEVSQQRFDFSGVTDAQFFEHAEAKVVEALRNYAEKAQNGQRLQRHLFIEDVVRGFAFIDVCRQKYSVVLMNPPFGSGQASIETYLAQNICDRTKDLSGLSVIRGLHFLEDAGTLGVVAPRSLLFLQSNETFRLKTLFGEQRLQLVADLGLRVMDEAWIEAAPFIVTNHASDRPVFIRVLDSDTKPTDLLSHIAALHLGDTPSSIYAPQLDSFRAYPYHIISYWLPYSYVRLFKKNESLAARFGTIRQGLATADDFRFLRLFPEVQNEDVGQLFFPFAKGGPYSPFFGLPELMVKWREGGKDYWEEKSKETGQPRSNVWMLKETINTYFKRRGLTYTRRTNSAFAPRVLPDDCIFADKGESIFCADDGDLPYVLGIMHSSPFQMLVEGFVANADSAQSEGAARGYVGGIIKSLPLPVPDREVHEIVSKASTELMKLHRQPFYADECFQLFVSPFVGQHPTTTESLQMQFLAAEKQHLGVAVQALKWSYQIEVAARTAYRLNDKDLQIIANMLGKHPEEYPESGLDPDVLKLYQLTEAELLKHLRENGISGRTFVNQSYQSSRKIEIISHLVKVKASSVATRLLEDGRFCPADLIDFCGRVVSYCYGIAVGRWDARIAIGKCVFEESIDPFASLPRCSPSMLKGADELPATETPPHYPVQVGWDGILVDDVEHNNDIVVRVRGIFEVIWGDRADRIEREICELLGVKDLRDYFRKPGKGGYWNDHLAHYSKSRRKAPIYWLLQSSKKNYALWLYYHRLDKDLLFKALVNYVEPKIRLETSRLESLLGEKAVAGESGKEAKRLAKELEEQEDFLSELRDFEDKLRRAANLQLVPDLNDGVVLNIAPLHELVPWKEAKSYWEALLKREYEWSSISQQLRQKGLVK